jgi:hypothetical protein
METVQSFDANSRPDRSARCEELKISYNPDKGSIKVNGNGIILIIQDASISSCEEEADGSLVIGTNEGRRVVFRSSTKSGKIKLRARLNRVLDSSKCGLKFELPSQSSSVDPVSSSQSGKNSLLVIGIAIASVLGLTVLSIYLLTATNSKNSVKESPENGTVVEDAWEARLEREREEWNKKQEKELAEQNQNSSAGASSIGNSDTEIASVIVSVSCAGSKGLIPRSKMGSTMKQIFDDKGIDSSQVFDRWNYYWNIAKEMDSYNKTYCLKE